jgi:hypothetical protein
MWDGRWPVKGWDCGETPVFTASFESYMKTYGMADALITGVSGKTAAHLGKTRI